MTALAALVALALLQDPPPVPQGPEPTFWVLPGALSAGAHQAGVMVALIGHERARARQALPGQIGTPVIGGISGTSSGSLNAVLAALALCADKGATFEPEHNLLWDAWRDLSWDALFPGDRDCRQYARDNPRSAVECSSHNPDAYGIRDGLWTMNAFTGVRRLLAKMAADTTTLRDPEKWANACQVRLAITLGAERPADLYLGTGPKDGQAKLPTSRRFTTVSLRFSESAGYEQTRRALKVCDEPMRWTADHLAPGATHLQLPFVEPPSRQVEWDPDRGSTRPVVGDPDCHQISTDAFLDLLTASMAVPLAFPPQPVAYCGARCERIERPGLYCPRGTTLCSGRFFDGSRFDGQPLSAALAMTEPNQRPTFVMAGGADARPKAEREKTEVPVPQEARGSAYYLSYAGGFVDTASQYERLMLQRYSTLSQGLLVQSIGATRPLVADVPIFDRTESIVGMTFPGLASFLHPDFRLFDYYVGIADGLSHLQEECVRSSNGGKDKEACRKQLRAEVNADVSPGLTRILDLMDGLPPRRCPEQTANCTLEECDRAAELERIWSALEFRRTSAREEYIDDPLRHFMEQLQEGRGDVHPYRGLAFAEDLEFWRFDQLRQAFHRMVAVESEDESDGTVALAGVGRFYAAVKAAEYRSGLSLGLASVPKGGGPLGAVVQLALPFRVQGDVNTGDLDLGWSTLVLSSPRAYWHASLGLTGHWYNFQPSGPKWSWGPTLEGWFTAHNKGTLRREHPILVNLIPDVGARATWFVGPYLDTAVGPQYSLGGFLRILGHLELELGGGSRGFFAKVGLTDVNGLMYWFFVTAQKPR